MIAALLPMAPLFLFKYPITELVQRLVAKWGGYDGQGAMSGG